MKLIVGLGNPGLEYEKTRHNVGFMAINYYAKEKNIKFSNHKFNSSYCEFVLNNEKVFLLRPEEYMNLSGVAIKKMINYFKIPIEDILVVYDDMDIEFGSYKLKKNGSSAGHNGIKNIIENLGTENFKRIKIGIGREKTVEMRNYVLSKFSKEEESIINETIEKLTHIINDFISDDFEKIMSRYN